MNIIKQAQSLIKRKDAILGTIMQNCYRRRSYCDGMYTMRCCLRPRLTCGCSPSYYNYGAPRFNNARSYYGYMSLYGM